MRAALKDDVPEDSEWLSDSNMKDYNDEHHEFVISIEAGLSDAIHEDEVAAAAAFIKGCLRLDLQKRLSAEECERHEWLEIAQAHSVEGGEGWK